MKGRQAHISHDRLFVDRVVHHEHGKITKQACVEKREGWPLLKRQGKRAFAHRMFLFISLSRANTALSESTACPVTL